MLLGPVYNCWSSLTFYIYISWVLWMHILTIFQFSLKADYMNSKQQTLVIILLYNNNSPLWHGHLFTCCVMNKEYSSNDPYSFDVRFYLNENLTGGGVTKWLHNYAILWCSTTKSETWLRSMWVPEIFLIHHVYCSCHQIIQSWLIQLWFITCWCHLYASSSISSIKEYL